jgi:putative molybdopterin biosynthesis protein
VAKRAELLTTREVADLLRVHPKHVYRLLRRGLPARRVGGEWRFSPEEVLRWSGASTPPSAAVLESTFASGDPPSPVPLLAGNGDVVMELLLKSISGSPAVGLVPADNGSGLGMLQRKEVVAAGSHGPPTAPTDKERLVFIHLVEREVGLAARPGVRLTHLKGLRRLRVASRPTTAGVRPRFDAELRKCGIDPEALHAQAALLSSHLDVVCAVARGDVDVGLASAAWAQRAGLTFRPVFTETYGLVLRACDLGDPRVVRVCETAQGAAFRRELASVAGYDTRRTGTILYGSKQVGQTEDAPSVGGAQGKAHKKRGR